MVLSPERSGGGRLTRFVLLAWGLTWLFTIPFVYSWRVLLGGEFAPWLLIFLPAPFGPTIAALVMARSSKRPGALRHLLGRLAIWRVGLGPSSIWRRSSARAWS